MGEGAESDRENKGSRLHIKNYVNKYPDYLNCLLFSSNRSLRDFAAADPQWVSPLAEDDYCEYQDKEFLDKLGLSEYWSELQDFWPKNGPVWDALATVQGKDDTTGVILLEAKSHIGELHSGCGAEDPDSKAKIERSLRRVQEALGMEQGTDWLKAYYQYANRIAHLHFLAEIANVPTWLIFLFFVSDKAWTDAPKSPLDWQRTLRDVERELGLSVEHPIYNWIITTFAPATE
jgi:hypothetical protein